MGPETRPEPKPGPETSPDPKPGPILGLAEMRPEPAETVSRLVHDQGEYGTEAGKLVPPHWRNVWSAIGRNAVVWSIIGTNSGHGMAAGIVWGRGGLRSGGGVGW